MNPAPTSVRARAWTRMRALFRQGATFTLDDLIANTARAGKRSERSNLRKYLTALAADGILAVVDTKNGKASRYRMVRNPGPTSPVLRSDGCGLTDPNALRTRAPRTEQIYGSRRSLVWKALRVFGQRRETFIVADIAVLIGQQSPTAINEIRRYVTALEASGHLKPSGDRCWRMARDTGPLYPILRRSGAVYDPNQQHEYEIGETA